MNRIGFQEWLDRYAETSRRYDEEVVSGLFAEDATYAGSPWAEVISGRREIVAWWRSDMAETGEVDCWCKAVALSEDLGVAEWWGHYPSGDASGGQQYSSVFLLRFDEADRCTSFREWFMEKPGAGA